MNSIKNFKMGVAYVQNATLAKFCMCLPYAKTRIFEAYSTQLYTATENEV